MPRRLHLTRIDRYIGTQLSVALLLVTLGFVALIWLTQSLRFIQIIVAHGLSPLVFIRLTSLLVPSFIATILPITSFIVVLFVYGRLSGDRELTIMRGIGLSDLSLARPALGVAAGAVLLGYALTLGVVPACLGAFRDYQYEIRNQIAAFLLEPGVFTPVTGQITVYVQARGPDDALRGILIEDGRDPNAPATILARTGRLIVNPDGPVVELENGSREQIDPKTGQLDVLSFKSNILSLAQPAKLGGRDYVDASEASLPALLHPSPELRPDERGKWLVEAQRRLTAPLSTLSYTLVGLVAVLGGAFRRYGGILRPAAAVAVVTVLVALGLGVSNLAARDVRLLPLIWAVTLLPGLWAAYLLARQGAPRA
ncbi:LPS export ABC transporter permease LptF [Acidocella sp. KAb 2-4]|uniref:LPS export ABC transporter permease LptF n=1 Tax=Acidocella sp. KAb 2-4 TaxID=2885158 RepID=UPI001D06DA18|nr:LPS export ABC transporter permease LptF [Acidocella sp. KAb 2-4]